MPDNNGSELSALLSSLIENKNLKRKLEVYADKFLQKSTKSRFGRHVLPSDLISSIILKLLAGKIYWDRKKYSLYNFFLSRIRTEIFNLTKKEKKFIPVPIEDSESFSDYEGEIEEDITAPPQFIIYPFEENDNDETIDPVEFEKIAYEIFKDSPEELCVLDEIFKGHKTNRIAVNLGITQNDVHNIKRRIIRILKAWAQRNCKHKTKPSEKPHFENKPGTPTPDINNIGELL